MKARQYWGTLVPFIAVGTSCSFFSAESAEAPTRITAAPPAQAPARELNDPAEVEQFLEEYGTCVVAGLPETALAIAFDRPSGFVGGSVAAAESSDRLDELEAAMGRCDRNLSFRVSVDAFAATSPEAAEFRSTGLQPAEGRQVIFGDPSLLDS